jgi:DUF1680 family protein
VTPAPVLKSFDLSAVRLTDGPVKHRQDLNRGYLLGLDPDRLLHNFRVQAGLPSSAAPLGGWEAPTCGLRGHFVGHYLSACAQTFASTGDAALDERAEWMVRELARCQDAIGTGYLSAFPESDLDAIETRFEGAWASYYTLHKILAGLVDVYRHCGTARRALDVAVRLADYVGRRVAAIEPARLEPMLRTDRKPNPTNEFGGMSEVLQDLYAVTREPAHLRLAQRFDREWFVEPLVRGEDRLTGLHCNTHVPMALGLARRYELTGDARFRDAAAYFWDRTALARSYVTGGSSGPRPDGAEKSKGGEHWPEPFKLAGTLTPKINESCVTHNMLRLTDALFRWTADPRYADFHERAFLNAVLCMQHPGYPGGYVYDHPLGPGSRKTFGHADDAFWCCYGTSVEAFGRLAQGVYYHAEGAVWVNLPVASDLAWPAKGLRVEQRTRFPQEASTRLTFRCDAPVDLTVHLRIPRWTRGGASVSVNGTTLDDVPARTGSFLSVRRTWCDGDVLDLALPMTVHAETMPDDPRAVAFLCGPLVLAARTGEDLVLNAPDAAAAVPQIRPVLGEPLTFKVTLRNGTDVTLVPVNRIVDETFGVYFRLQPNRPS